MQKIYQPVPIREEGYSMLDTPSPCASPSLGSPTSPQVSSGDSTKSETRRLLPLPAVEDECLFSEETKAPTPTPTLLPSAQTEYLRNLEATVNQVQDRVFQKAMDHPLRQKFEDEAHDRAVEKFLEDERLRTWEDKFADKVTDKVRSGIIKWIEDEKLSVPPSPPPPPPPTEEDELQILIPGSPQIPRPPPPSPSSSTAQAAAAEVPLQTAVQVAQGDEGEWKKLVVCGSVMFVLGFVVKWIFTDRC